MPNKRTAPGLASLKAKQQPIVCITAYDALEASLVDDADVDVVLVGDSVGNAKLGFDNTVPVTLEMVAHHTAAVRRGLRHALLVADLPFGSYQSGVAQAVNSAVTLMRAGAEAVKLEGPYYDEVRALVKAGIPVMGHLGMTPQSVNAFGGFRVQGRSDEAATRIREEALRLQDLGSFAVVLELIPSALAEDLSRALSIPTIGIGAGVGCDGQIQVLTDILGLAEQTFKHSKAYIDGAELFRNALSRYTEEVRERAFPTSENSF